MKISGIKFTMTIGNVDSGHERKSKDDYFRSNNSNVSDVNINYECDEVEITSDEMIELVKNISKQAIDSCKQNNVINKSNDYKIEKVIPTRQPGWIFEDDNGCSLDKVESDKDSSV